jgi:hypothetical protein
MTGNKVTVDRVEVARLLGLPDDTDDETLSRVLADRFTTTEEERQARAEDRGLIAAAFNDGRISKGRIGVWEDAMRRDRGAAREVLACLMPGLPPKEPMSADAGVEAVHAQLMSRLSPNASAGVAAPPKRTVGASAPPAVAPAPRDGLGIEKPAVPAPVNRSRGKHPSTWTDEERQNYLLHKLGPRFSQGVPQPPAWTPHGYQPSPNDPYEWVPDSDGNGGQFRPKPDYQSRYSGGR